MSLSKLTIPKPSLHSLSAFFALASVYWLLFDWFFKGAFEVQGSLIAVGILFFACFVYLLENSLAKLINSTNLKNSHKIFDTKMQKIATNTKDPTIEVSFDQINEELDNQILSNEDNNLEDLNESDYSFDEYVYYEEYVAFKDEFVKILLKTIDIDLNKPIIVTMSSKTLLGKCSEKLLDIPNTKELITLHEQIDSSISKAHHVLEQYSNKPAPKYLPKKIDLKENCLSVITKIQNTYLDLPFIDLITSDDTFRAFVDEDLIEQIISCFIEDTLISGTDLSELVLFLNVKNGSAIFGMKDSTSVQFNETVNSGYKISAKELDKKEDQFNQDNQLNRFNNRTEFDKMQKAVNLHGGNIFIKENNFGYSYFVSLPLLPN